MKTARSAAVVEFRSYGESAAEALDAAGAGLLGVDWRTVGHIRMADGVFGHAK